MNGPGQPYKICPECGQPAGLHEQACARCGHVYRTQFTQSGQPLAPQEPMDGRTVMVPSLEPPARSSSATVAAVAGLIGLTALVILLLIVASLPRERSAEQPTGQEAAAPPAMTSSGFFRERPSNVETPTLRISTDYEGGVILILTGVDGCRYTVTSFPGRDGVIQVPAGDYGVELLSHDGSIEARSGTAVFRRFRAYDASFTLVSRYPWEELPPLRLGDQ